MKRTNIYIGDKQHEVLKRLAKEDGIRMSEVIRRAIDFYLRMESSKDLKESKDK